MADDYMRGLIADAIQFRLPAFLSGHTDQALYVAAGKCADAVLDVLKDNQQIVDGWLEELAVAEKKAKD